MSPIANKKIEDEFDFEIEKLFNNNKDRFDTNSLLNMNISNMTNTYMTNNGNITGKVLTSFKNLNFFDSSVLNNINTSGYLTNVGNFSYK